MNNDPQPSNNYQIVIAGRLEPQWSAWFNGLSIQMVSGEQPTTILSGEIKDQAALRGILMRIWDLNLDLISVNPLATNVE